jgi:hypothetical protein
LIVTEELPSIKFKELFSTVECWALQKEKNEEGQPVIRNRNRRRGIRIGGEELYLESESFRGRLWKRG